MTAQSVFQECMKPKVKEATAFLVFVPALKTQSKHVPKDATYQGRDLWNNKHWFGHVAMAQLKIMGCRYMVLEVR